MLKLNFFSPKTKVTTDLVASLQIKRHEGLRQKPYRDTMGILTIGYGWNLEANGLPTEVIDYLFDLALADAVSIAKLFADKAWNKLNIARQAVLINMAYNLGNRLFDFKTFHTAILNHEWGYAARRMRSTLWYKQVKNRGEELALQMETGEIRISQSKI